MKEVAELAAARALVGMDHVELDEDRLTIRFDREGVMIERWPDYAYPVATPNERAPNVLRLTSGNFNPSSSV